PAASPNRNSATTDGLSRNAGTAGRSYWWTRRTWRTGTLSSWLVRGHLAVTHPSETRVTSPTPPRTIISSKHPDSRYSTRSPGHRGESATAICAPTRRAAVAFPLLGGESRDGARWATTTGGPSRSSWAHSTAIESTLRKWNDS